MKRITIYDAEIKKNRCYAFNRKDFKSDEEFEKLIKKVRDDQKLKNKSFKENEKKTKFDKIMSKEIKHEEKPVINTLTNMYIMNNVNNFKLDQNTANTCVIFGSGKTGKTTLLAQLYKQYYLDDKDFISTLFSGNRQLDVYKLDKKLIIGDGFTRQSEKYIKLEKYINMKTNNHYKFLNMFDDIIHAKFSQVINNSILIYRNSNISTIMLLQYGYLLSKQNRANVNNIFIFRSHTQEAKKDIIDLFLKDKFMKMGLNTYAEMLEFYNDVTDNHGFFYIHNGAVPIFTIHRLKI